MAASREEIQANQEGLAECSCGSKSGSVSWAFGFEKGRLLGASVAFICDCGMVTQKSDVDFGDDGILDDPTRVIPRL